MWVFQPRLPTLPGSSRVPPSPLPEFATSNPNSVIEKFRTELTASASSVDGPSWPATKLFDGQALTSWFSQRGDTTTQHRQPWVQVSFPEKVRVRHITILANRDTSWPGSFAIVTGRLELRNEREDVIYVEERGAANEYGDLDFVLPRGVDDVHTIRFISISDNGDQNSYQEVALGEMMVD